MSGRLLAVCVIPARGGSVRIPRKNARLFRGVPMVVRAIQTAKAVIKFTHIIVSTDDDEIEALSLAAGAEVHRRPLDDGTKGTQDVVADALVAAGVPGGWLVCTLYPCTPLLRGSDISAAGTALVRRSSCALYAIDISTDDDAGAFYWQYSDDLAVGKRLDANALRWGLPDGRAIDINTPEDWARAEAMYDALQPRIKA